MSTSSNIVFFVLSTTMLFCLSACQQPNQNTINEADLGKTSLVVFGTVLTKHEVTIKRQTSGTGAIAGATAGGIGGSYVGGGRAALFSMTGGAVIGGVTGHMAEQGIINNKGMEYVIKVHNPGKEFRHIITITQNIAKDDKPINKGDCVMVQTQGSYQRILPEEDVTLCKQAD